MKRTSWPVTAESGPRPAGKPDECFYCKVKVGGEHAADCVMRRRTVVCRVSVEYVRDVPEDWTKEDIEFHMNESTSCADNLLDEIADLANRLDDADAPCSCGRVEGEYLREADEDDEAYSMYGIANVEEDDRPAADAHEDALYILQRIRHLVVRDIEHGHPNDRNEMEGHLAAIDALLKDNDGG